MNKYVKYVSLSYDALIYDMKSRLVQDTEKSVEEDDDISPNMHTQEDDNDNDSDGPTA